MCGGGCVFVHVLNNSLNIYFVFICLFCASSSSSSGDGRGGLWGWGDGGGGIRLMSESYLRPPGRSMTCQKAKREQSAHRTPGNSPECRHQPAGAVHSHWSLVMKSSDSSSSLFHLWPRHLVDVTLHLSARRHMQETSSEPLTH